MKKLDVFEVFFLALALKSDRKLDGFLADAIKISMKYPLGAIYVASIT